MGLKGLEKFKVLFLLRLQLVNKLYVPTSSTFNKLFQVSFLALSYYGFFCHNLLDKFIDISPNIEIWTYYAQRLSKSIDFVSCSPLLLTYSSRMPGG